MRVAFQGERGAYSEEAAVLRWGAAAEPLPCPYLDSVFDAVEEGEADLGLVPVENTIEGSVLRTFDLLNERSLSAQGETILRVRHCLIANPGVELGNVRVVYSHPQALGQSRAYLEELGVESVASYDTAGSVRMIKERGLLDAAAVASRRAAEYHGMTVLAEGIETHPENYTRFLVVGWGESSPTGNDKTSVAFITRHEPGALARALNVVSDAGVNMTKIESRPQLGKPWEYIFFVDLEGHREAVSVRGALESLRGRTVYLKVLGSYPAAYYSYFSELLGLRARTGL
jgi:chorismate mutase/prephenate dehydratase